jgi:hypothetical protein
VADIVEILPGNSIVEVVTPGGESSIGFALPTYTIQGESGLDPEPGDLPLTNTTGRTLRLRNARAQFVDESTGLVEGQALVIDARKGATSLFGVSKPTIGVGQSTVTRDFPDVVWLANEAIYVDLIQAPSNTGRCKLIVQFWAD